MILDLQLFKCQFVAEIALPYAIASNSWRSEQSRQYLNNLSYIMSSNPI